MIRVSILAFAPMRAPILLLWLLAADPLGAQTIIGRVVSIASRQPLGGIQVALVDDSARVAAVTVTDSVRGEFFVDAPHPGRYRVALYSASGASSVGPPVVLDSGATLQQIYSMPELPPRFAGVPRIGEVTKPAAFKSGSPMPRFPDELKMRRMRGSVTLAVVVDESGRPHTDSALVMLSSDDRFTDAVKRSLERTQFVPAERDGTPTAQLVQLTYAFQFQGDVPMPADVYVWAMGVTRRVEIGTKVEVVPVGPDRRRNP